MNIRTRSSRGSPDFAIAPGGGTTIIAGMFPRTRIFLGIYWSAVAVGLIPLARITHARGPAAASFSSPRSPGEHDVSSDLDAPSSSDSVPGPSDSSEKEREDSEKEHEDDEDSTRTEPSWLTPQLSQIERAGRPALLEKPLLDFFKGSPAETTRFFPRPSGERLSMLLRSDSNHFHVRFQSIWRHAPPSGMPS